MNASVKALRIEYENKQTGGIAMEVRGGNLWEREWDAKGWL